MTNFFINTLPGIIIAIFASCLTSAWALRKFYSEKWWERKERAYTEIIDALYHLIAYCEVQKEDYGAGTGYSDDKMKELSKMYNQAIWKIKKATEIGSFVLSVKANTVLRELRNRPRLEWNENPSWEIFEQDYNYYKNSLEKISEIARNDLKASKA